MRLEQQTDMPSRKAEIKSFQIKKILQITKPFLNLFFVSGKMFRAIWLPGGVVCRTWYRCRKNKIKNM